VVRQVFFCGGDKDEFDEWKRGLSDIAKAATKEKAEQTLKLQTDDEAFTAHLRPPEPSVPREAGPEDRHPRHQPVWRGNDEGIGSELLIRR
jgi:hypothetical protein